MKTTITTIIALSIFLFSCNDTNATKHSTTQAHHHQHDETIALNKGKKWKVDKNMMTHIRNMENEVSIFTTESSKDYATLAKKINTNIGLLTSNCTMKGQAHDELHKWLLPFIELSEKFSASKTEKESTAIFQEIKTSFITFNTYFE